MNNHSNKYILNKKSATAYNKTRSLFKRRFICFAPYKTMRFSVSGIVHTCCYNRYLKLGTYPEQNLHNIWFGEQNKLLQKNISNHDFSQGCQTCHEFISANNFYGAGCKNYDYLPKSRNSFPVMLEFEASNICNLACIMCNGDNSSYFRKEREKKEPYTVPYDDDFVTQLKEFIPFLYEARFVGGEPFLTPLYYKIWEEILKINPRVKISVLTNATILNEQIKQLLNEGNFNISVSIDSFTKETYESIRINSDFNNVMKNFDYFYSYSIQNKKWFNINICPIKNNMFEIPSIVDFCNKKEINIFFHTVYAPANCSLWSMSSSELKSLIDFTKQYRPNSDTKTKAENANIFYAYLKQLESWYEKAIIRESKNIVQNHFMSSKKIILEKLSVFLLASGKDENYTKSILYKADSIIEKIKKENISNNAMHFLMNTPENKIIAEIENFSEEKLVEKLKQICV